MNTKPASNRTPYAEKRRQITFAETSLERMKTKHRAKEHSQEQKIQRLKEELQGMQQRTEA